MTYVGSEPPFRSMVPSVEIEPGNPRTTEMIYVTSRSLIHPRLICCRISLPQNVILSICIKVFTDVSELKNFAFQWWCPLTLLCTKYPLFYCCNIDDQQLVQFLSYFFVTKLLATSCTCEAVSQVRVFLSQDECRDGILHVDVPHPFPRLCVCVRHFSDLLFMFVSTSSNQQQHRLPLLLY